MGYIIFFIFLSGCITNPHLNDQYYDKKVKELPQFEDQIRAEQKNQKEIQFQQGLKSRNSTVYSNSEYTVYERVKGAVGIGGENSVFLLGYEDIEYTHVIQVHLVCNDHEIEALRSKPSYKPVEWKVSEKIKGVGTANLNGTVKITFNSDESTRIDSLKLIIDSKVYDVSFNKGYNLEVAPTVCKK